METKYVIDGAINEAATVALYSLEYPAGLTDHVRDISKISRIGQNVFIDFQSDNFECNETEYTRIVLLASEEEAEDFKKQLEALDPESYEYVSNFTPADAVEIDAQKCDTLGRVGATQISSMSGRDSILFVNLPANTEVAYVYGGIVERDNVVKQIKEARGLGSLAS